MRSFEINHLILKPGFYYHGDSLGVTTWDMRVVAPNSSAYMDGAAIHTIEHLMASYLRSHLGNDKIVGVFPMGCKTGFYILTRFMTPSEVLMSMKDFCEYASSVDTIPGNTPIECGNCSYHNLNLARTILYEYLEEVLSVINENNIYYEED